MFKKVPTADKICKIKLQMIVTFETDSETMFKLICRFICNKICEIEHQLIFHLKQILKI